MARSKYPEIAELLELVRSKSPLQFKRIRRSLNDQSVDFEKSFARFLREYKDFADARGFAMEEVVQAYIKMCNDMLSSQIYFSKHNQYPVNNQAEAFLAVYDSKDEMESYMLGLALSQFLWPTHYAMFRFFQKMLHQKSAAGSYLEVGPGHGLLFNEALRVLPNSATFAAVDISETSLNLTKEVVEFFQLHDRKLSFRNEDISDFEETAHFEFIVAGELLEHVDEPVAVLRKLRTMMACDGVAFISTCVDCPTIDHVYHFQSIGEVREMLRNNGFEIVEDAVLPVEDLPLEDLKENKVTINYCAHLCRSLENEL